MIEPFGLRQTACSGMPSTAWSVVRFRATSGRPVSRPNGSISRHQGSGDGKDRGRHVREQPVRAGARSAALGAPDEAESLMLRSLAISEKLEAGTRNLAIGPGRPRRPYRTTRNMGRPWRCTSAEIDRRVASGCRRPACEHPAGIGSVYMAQGKYAEADPYLTRALAAAKKTRRTPRVTWRTTPQHDHPPVAAGAGTTRPEQLARRA